MDQSYPADPSISSNLGAAIGYRRRAFVLSLFSLAAMVIYIISTYFIFLRQVVVVVNKTGPGYQYYSKSIYYYGSLHPALFIATAVSLLAAWFVTLQLAFRYNRKAVELYSGKKTGDLSPNERRAIMKEINARMRGKT